jgi:peptidoglycan-associated lipoprotein
MVRMDYRTQPLFMPFTFPDAGGIFRVMKTLSQWTWTALVLVSCAHAPTNKTEVASAQPATATPPPAPEAAPAPNGACSVDRECGEKELCIRSKCVPISSGLSECAQVRVHFDFDMVDIKDTDKPGLNRIARCLRADAALRVTVEGNSDERGTEEYNLALGQRRAGVVDQYLEALGVSSAQLKTISYGYERPVCKQHNEQCWAKNRRASLKPQEESAAHK